MCGIVAYIGAQDAAPILLDGLKRLEYRGYDSAGIAVVQDGKIVLRRAAGKLSNLIRNVQLHPVHEKDRERDFGFANVIEESVL